MGFSRPKGLVSEGFRGFQWVEEGFSRPKGLVSEGSVALKGWFQRVEGFSGVQTVEEG